MGKLTGGNLSGKYESHDREQITRGTIGAVDIIIRDGDNQRQDVASINRDLAKAQEITKDESAGTEVYASDTAIKEIVTGFKGFKDGLQNIGAAAASGFEQFPRDIRDAVTDAARRLGLSGATPDGAATALVDDLAAKGRVDAGRKDAIRKAAVRAAVDDRAYAELRACGKQEHSLSGVNSDRS